MYDKKDTTNSNPAESFPAPVAHSLKRIHKRTECAAGKAGARNATPNKAQQRESGTQLRTRHSGRQLRPLSFFVFAVPPPCSRLLRALRQLCACLRLASFPSAVPRSPSCSAFPARLGFRPVPLFARCASFSVLFRAPAFPAAHSVLLCVLRRRNRCGKALGSSLLIHIETTPTLFKKYNLPVTC